MDLIAPLFRLDSLEKKSANECDGEGMHRERFHGQWHCVDVFDDAADVDVVVVTTLSTESQPREANHTNSRDHQR